MNTETVGGPAATTSSAPAQTTGTEGVNMNMLTKSQLDKMSTAELVKLYNEKAGKTIKKFSSRDAGINQLLKLASSNGITGKSEANKKAAATAKKTKKPSAPKERRSAADISVAVAKTWSDPKVRAARSERTAVSVDGEKYRSVAAAFKALKLSNGKMPAFRKALKNSAGKLTFDGKVFSVLKEMPEENAK